MSSLSNIVRETVNDGTSAIRHGVGVVVGRSTRVAKRHPFAFGGIALLAVGLIGAAALLRRR